MLAVYAQGPPSGRASEEFQSKQRRGLVRIIQGQEYARMATDTRERSRALKAMYSIKEMLEFEGWADVRVLEDA